MADDQSNERASADYSEKSFRPTRPITTNMKEPRRPRFALSPKKTIPTEGRITGFAEFDRNINRVANALNALGVRPGERIAYLGKNSDIYFELLLGAMKANVVMAPVNWRLAGPEVAFIVDDKAPALFASRRCRAIRPARFYGGTCASLIGWGRTER